MKKAELEGIIADQQRQLNERSDDRHDLEMLRVAYREIDDEVKLMREHWRPVPITHEWQPRNPQCALCDEPRDSARHAVDKTGD